MQFPSTHACLLVQGICQSWHSHCLSIKCNSFKARDTLCLANSRWLCAASFINFAACFDPALLCAVFCFLSLRVSLVLFFLYLHSTFSLCFLSIFLHFVSFYVVALAWQAIKLRIASHVWPQFLLVTAPFPSPFTRAACSVVVSIVIDILMPCNCLRQMPKPKPLLGNSCQQFARQTNRNSNRNTHTHTHTSCTLSLAPLTSCPLPPSFCVSAQHYKQLKTALQALNSHLCIVCSQMRISLCVCLCVFLCRYAC